MCSLSGSEISQLLRRARAGSTSAQGQLLERYRAYLSLMARVQIGQRLARKADASDMVQDAFLRASRDFTGFGGSTEAELVSWLRKILATSLADQIRRYGRPKRDTHLERELETDLDRSSMCLDRNLVNPSDSPSQQMANRERSVLLADALTQLPEDYREVLVLKHLEDASFPEIAAKMNRTLDSVKNLWGRGLIELRKQLRNLS